MRAAWSLRIWKEGCVSGLVQRPGGWRFTHSSGCYPRGSVFVPGPHLLSLTSKFSKTQKSSSQDVHLNWCIHSLPDLGQPVQNAWWWWWWLFIYMLTFFLIYLPNGAKQNRWKVSVDNSPGGSSFMKMWIACVKGDQRPFSYICHCWHCLHVVFMWWVVCLWVCTLHTLMSCKYCLWMHRKSVFINF